MLGMVKWNWRPTCGLSLGRGARLRVIFHPPVAVTGDRKDLARTCQERVAAALPA